MSEEAQRMTLGCERRKHEGRVDGRALGRGDFDFRRVIGKGSFGRVYLAHDRGQRTCFAIKVLQKRMDRQQETRTKHIMSERNVLLKNLSDHPFLVGLHYRFQTKDKLYFVLDYISGGELFFYLQKEQVFSENRARFYAAEAGSAVGYLHSRGIIYRDLKPENMLLDKQGHIVLTDFGLCKEGLIGSTQTSTFCGTPEYMAPEVLLKLPYDRSVDWWCLGAVLYEMLYGLPPFYNRNTHEMYNSILHGRPRLRSSASAAAQQLLTALLQKKSEARLGSGPSDFDEIKAHPFFAPIHWEDLLRKRVTPPLRPRRDSTLSQLSLDRHFVGFSYDPGCELHDGD
ncbi:LOW QUALITY PROTEIN: serine/threonine-protein kinase Sgk1-like [Pollicipes pollicipes]|uniref:LOW QUALITY PROTEIN: serine/threonine-protein kinase Sgk1-like n=1 Tax=Pollicipes pollicipes TaxID=41117 RepID=UPI001884A077|nr:LOW QUALITY PROTEIN: serine/threonine-protein kinase Sgk1-like [Pollicipes pollicipes]